MTVIPDGLRDVTAIFHYPVSHLPVCLAYFPCQGYLSHVMRKPVYAICEQQSADQPVHPCSLTSNFIVRYLDSIILR